MLIYVKSPPLQNFKAKIYKSYEGEGAPPFHSPAGSLMEIQI